MRFIPLFALLLLLGCQNASQETEATQETVTEETDEVASPASTAATSALNIGDTAPDFELMGADGELHALQAMADANEGVIVTFTCNTCPYAVKYEDRLIALHTEMAELGYPVLAVQPNDTEIKPGDNLEAMVTRVTEKEIPYTYVIDEKQEVYPTYGATRTPEIFLLAKDRTLLYHGAIDDDTEGTDVTVNYVKNAIAAHQAGEAIDPVNVKAIGCTIKAK
ncbi:MAG: thioredoxin family protein [Bacteroidota bacterium]